MKPANKKDQAFSILFELIALAAAFQGWVVVCVMAFLFAIIIDPPFKKRE